MKTPHCTLCDAEGHYKTFCTYRTKNGYKPHTNGKYARKWLRTRKKWINTNPPNHEGYYECYLCHKFITLDEMTLDHIIPRSHAPELRFEFSNLAPCCGPCNTKKGSQHNSDDAVRLGSHGRTFVLPTNHERN